MGKACTLEITVISAEGLRIAGRSIKKNTLVTVGTDSNNFLSTSMDRDGGSYPSWNEKLQLPLPPSAQSIAVEVHCKTSTGWKTVGTVNVPMSDIVEDYVPASHLHFLSYRLRERDGEPNGIVNLSVRLVGYETIPKSNPLVKRVDPGYVRRPSPLPPGKRCSGGNGIAVGIPVHYGY